MAVCKRCANIDLDDAATRYTYLLGHVRVIIASGKAGCPGCSFIVGVAGRRGVDIRDKRDFYVVLRRLGKRSHKVEVHFVWLDGEDEEGSGEVVGEVVESAGTEEVEEDEDESEEDSEEGDEESSEEEDGESSEEEDEDSEDEDTPLIQLKLCSTYGQSACSNFSIVSQELIAQAWNGLSSTT